MASDAAGTTPTFAIERAHGAPRLIVCGVDEAGRGALAGPLVAAAAALAHDTPLPLLDDSKRLTDAARRQALRDLPPSARVALGRVSARFVEEHGPLDAALEAMARALDALNFIPDVVIVDGPHPLKRAPLGAKVITQIKADSLSLSVACASIAAKVARDDMMLRLDTQYPGYGFARHKGYPTAAHRHALAKLGVCQEHRRTYAPVRHILETQR